MHSTYCAMVVSLGHFPSDPSLESARKHLESAIAFSNQYYKTYYSIQWNESSLKVKQRIRRKCHQLAFDCYSHMLEVTLPLNNYADEQAKLNKPVPDCWQHLVFNLKCAFRWLEREHAHEIHHLQLALLSYSQHSESC